MFDLNDCSQDKIERSVYVTNLSFKITSDDLEELFSHVGKVEASHAFFDKELLRPAGRGIVLFSKKEEAQRAIKELDGISIKGRKIRVQINIKNIKLLNFKRGPVDDDLPDQSMHHSSFSSDHSHENIHLSRSSSRKSFSGKHHDSHRGRHSAAIDDYDYDYDMDYELRRRERERSREKDKSRHNAGKYDYDSPFDHDYEYERSKSKVNLKSIDRKIERRQMSSRISDGYDERKSSNSPIREKSLFRMEYNDPFPNNHVTISEKEKESQHIFLHPPPILPQQLPPPPLMQMQIPIKPSLISDHAINTKNLEYEQNIHSMSIADELFSDIGLDIGNDIPHNIWMKVIKNRAQKVYDHLYSITNDHQIIKTKVLLRFQPNEALTVANFIDALSPSPK